MKNNPSAELARLASEYTAQAAPASAEATDEVMTRHEVDLMILNQVFDAAQIRARRQGRTMAAIARAILFKAAADAQPDPSIDPESRPPLREYRRPEERKRLRFSLPITDYHTAKDVLTSAGTTVSQVVEDGLRSYARTGRI